MCAYCGHRSRLAPARPRGAPQEAALAEAIARFAAQRARAAHQIDQRGRDAAESKQTENAWVLLGLGALFLFFALGCGAITLAVLTSNRPRVDNAFGFALFGAFWAVFGGLMVHFGLRFRRAGARARFLRAKGVPGRATITSYKEGHLVLDGHPHVEMVLHVELAGHPPRDTTHAEYVPRMACVTTGAELPIFANPRDPSGG